MKKIVAGIFAVSVLFSCQKKQIEPEVVENSGISLKQVSEEEVSQILAPKQNDTLYVTNFFATWCAPCMKEIPHFKTQKSELADKPVKFRFISLDSKNDWAVAVISFAVQNGLENDVFLLDGAQLSDDFFKKQFKEWDGSSIPFTTFKKGDKTSEFVGMITENELRGQIQSMLK